VRDGFWFAGRVATGRPPRAGAPSGTSAGRRAPHARHRRRSPNSTAQRFEGTRVTRPGLLRQPETSQRLTKRRPPVRTTHQHSPPPPPQPPASCAKTRLWPPPPPPPPALPPPGPTTCWRPRRWPRWAAGPRCRARLLVARGGEAKPSRPCFSSSALSSSPPPHQNPASYLRLAPCVCAPVFFFLRVFATVVKHKTKNVKNTIAILSSVFAFFPINTDILWACFVPFFGSARRAPAPRALDGMYSVRERVRDCLFVSVMKIVSLTPALLY
jgi:hypothetical protein